MRDVDTGPIAQPITQPITQRITRRITQRIAASTVLLLGLILGSTTGPAQASHQHSQRASHSLATPPLNLQIIGGTPTTAEAAPWQVRLEITGADGNRILCGGSLLSPTWVVTAAHCLVDANHQWATRVDVAAGISTVSDRGQRVAGHWMYLPRGYDRRSFREDIGLIELASPLTLDGVRTAAIALPYGLNSDWPEVGTTTQISGWGLTAQSPDLLPQQLQLATVTVLAAPGGPCLSGSLSSYDRDLMMCAGLQDGSSDSCSGDSGGPATVVTQGIAYLAGVTSHGSHRCGLADRPAVYTRVTAFLNWITSVTGIIPTASDSGIAPRPPAHTSSQRSPRPVATGALQHVEVIGGTTVVSGQVIGQIAELTGANTHRISGPNRYATAVATTQRVHPHGAATVYLASGAGFADALSASTVLARKQGALLLTAPDQLLPEVAEELVRLNPSQVVLIGGEAAINQTVAVQIQQLLQLTPTRLSGVDRYGTSVAVSGYGVPEGGGVLYLATGTNFADALSAAIALNDPQSSLLLTESDRLPSVVAEEIRRLAPHTVYLIGGQAAISDQVVREVAAVSGVTPLRIAGVDRSATVSFVNQHAFPEGTSRVYIVNGSGFADALTAAQGVLVHGASLVLVGRDSIPEATQQELTRLTTMARDAQRVPPPQGRNPLSQSSRDHHLITK
jgi:secreted trypsin-like serine protease/putative cell wall-binding protein